MITSFMSKQILFAIIFASAFAVLQACGNSKSTAGTDEQPNTLAEGEVSEFKDFISGKHVLTPLETEIGPTPSNDIIEIQYPRLDWYVDVNNQWVSCKKDSKTSLTYNVNLNENLVIKKIWGESSKISELFEELCEDENGKYSVDTVGDYLYCLVELGSTENGDGAKVQYEDPYLKEIGLVILEFCQD